MLLTLRRHKEQRPFSRARRRGASVVAVRLAACVVAATALWSAAPAVADDVPPVPGVTTTTEAPPPDPYSPPARTTKPKPAAHSVAPAVRSAPTMQYVSPAAVAPAQVTRVPRHRIKHSTKAAQKRRTHSAGTRTVSPPFKMNLAPLQAIATGAERPLVPVSNGHDRYLWLAGSSFAVLALAGLSLLMLTMRIARDRTGVIG
ncbi:MAG: hypothetical protein ACXVE1_02605 [Gaiellaceae bacterium]